MVSSCRQPSTSLTVLSLLDKTASKEPILPEQGAESEPSLSGQVDTVDALIHHSILPARKCAQSYPAVLQKRDPTPETRCLSPRYGCRVSGFGCLDLRCKLPGCHETDPATLLSGM